MASDFPSEFNRRTIASVLATFALVCGISAATNVTASPEFSCESGATLATGRSDPSLFAQQASRTVRAFWCERYDRNGNAMRTGPYWETYANGHPRTVARYVDSQLEGPVSVHNEDGTLFLRGFLRAGDWSGDLKIFHGNGAVWFEARFDSGRLEGALRTHFPDGALESETRFQGGREDGLARSFYPTAAGGRLKSEAHVEGDELVGRHRVLNRNGEIIRAIDWNTAPISWRRIATLPAAPALNPRDRANLERELDRSD